ncbi:bifunctional diguanylate cyclase/phosphodiesterase [Deinococcus xianganensis]|uniref:EAL domain-containing protein n=1 Tax=Deinococcus xianganensis TaxID=1507289 RepID=A0A6I4YSL6_9DEIO|nr:bifunctional diguanylate cyclase/phosphodiesterase [Deinococcus xianganensis]MXV21967.1 EAL domain-containing protein [Deinococcus xianganensis]
MLDPAADFGQLIRIIQSGDPDAAAQAIQHYDFSRQGQEHRFYAHALLHYYAHRHQLAAREAEQAASLALIAQDHELYASALILQGTCSAILFATDAATESFHRALEVFDRSDDQAGRARAMVSLANIHAVRGENHSALNFAQQALSALSTPGTGDPGSGLAITINNVLGMVYSNLEAFETAERYFRTCAALTLQQGHASAFVTASVNLLECLSRGGRNDEACREIERLIAHPDYRTLITPHVLNTAGEIALRAGRQAQAVAHLQAARQASAATQDYEEYCRSIITLAQVDGQLISGEDIREVIRISETDSRADLLEQGLQAAVGFGGFSDDEKVRRFYPQLVRALHHRAVALREQTIGDLTKKAELDNARHLAGYEQQLRVAAEETIQRQVEELERGRLSDVLTGLPNRIMLMAQMLRQTREDAPFLLVTLDVNRFQLVNDMYGHDLADELLRVLAQRLSGSLRSGELVARVGGDEFALLLEPGANARAQVDRVLAVVTQPVSLGGQSVRVSVSAGAALWPQDAGSAEALRRASELALLDAKANADAVRFFDARAHAHAGLESALAHALTRGEYVLHYQPLVDTRHRRVVSAEALLRWESPEHGLQSPAAFMPILERGDHIIEVGAWVLREACRAAQSWGGTDVRVAVNLSARQFTSPGLLDTVRQALRETGLPPHRLELEITETLMMLNPERTERVLRDLRSDGVRVMLDDFGTGYSSLGYLARFPLSGLKIDRSFVRQMMQDQQGKSAAIVRAMVSLSRDLNLELVAEGIESLQDLDVVMAEGICVVQGYHFARPAPDWRPPGAD